MVRFGVLGLYMLHTMCELLSDAISCCCALHKGLSFKKKEVMYVRIVMVLSQTTKINSRH